MTLEAVRTDARALTVYPAWATALTEERDYFPSRAQFSRVAVVLPEDVY